MTTFKLFKGLLIATALFIFAYWTSVFTGIFPVEEITAGYKNWFMSFPIPDFYVAGCALFSRFIWEMSEFRGKDLIFRDEIKWKF
jgi:hypothetical protein